MTAREFAHVLIPVTVATLVSLLLTQCGITSESGKKDSRSGLNAQDHIQKYSQPDSANQSDSRTTTSLNGVTIIPIKCRVPKSNLAFLASLTQDLYGRSPTAAEIKKAAEPTFDRKKFIDESVAADETDIGIARFVSNLFLLPGLQPDLAKFNNNDKIGIAKEAATVADLQKEPIELVLRDKGKPWGDYFLTRDFYCTKNTASYYGLTVLDGNFVRCTMPPERAGFMGMVSVLRASPSNMYSTNNNYHRVSSALYWAQGIQLLSATNGPVGTGAGLGLPGCVPSTDQRKDGSLVFGTAAIPAQGAQCASCHSRYNGPMSVAFRRFDSDGSALTMERIDALQAADLHGASANDLKFLVNETESCWSSDGVAPPRSFSGVPGLARLIVDSNTLGHALGIQIPKMLGGQPGDANMASTIEKTYQDNGKTLQSAIKGYLASDSYQCAEKEE